jgi:hypothetical protein
MSPDDLEVCREAGVSFGFPMAQPAVEDVLSSTVLVGIEEIVGHRNAAILRMLACGIKQVEIGECYSLGRGRVAANAHKSCVKVKKRDRGGSFSREVLSLLKRKPRNAELFRRLIPGENKGTFWYEEERLYARVGDKRWPTDQTRKVGYFWSRNIDPEEKRGGWTSPAECRKAARAMGILVLEETRKRIVDPCDNHSGGKP